MINVVLIIYKKRTCNLQDFAVATDHRGKIKESWNIYKDLDLARELKMENLSDVENNCNWWTWKGLQILRKTSEKIGNQKKNQDHQKHWIVKIDSNTQKNTQKTRILRRILKSPEYPEKYSEESNTKKNIQRNPILRRILRRF